MHKNNIPIKVALGYSAIAIIMILAISLVYSNTKSIIAVNEASRDYIQKRSAADSTISSLLKEEQKNLKQLSDVMQTGVITIPEKRRDYIEKLLDKLIFENEGQDPLSPGFVSVALAELILFITRCKQYEENVIKEIDVDNQIMQEVATYIYNHYSEKLVLEDMAKQFNLSRSYLSKKFKSVTGFGFKEYIINVRIKHACELLLNTNKSITTIAFECGFNDSNYFGDAFRRTKGISPNKYRRNQENI